MRMAGRIQQGAGPIAGVGIDYLPMRRKSFASQGASASFAKTSEKACIRA